MVTLNLFIDSHYKYIVSIIRVKHILTLHLSTANCRILPTTGCCCKNAAATHCSCYAIYFCLVESIPQFLELWPVFSVFKWNSNFTLLYRNATLYGIMWVKFKPEYDMYWGQDFIFCQHIRLQKLWRSRDDPFHGLSQVGVKDKFRFLPHTIKQAMIFAYLLEMP